MHVTEGRMSRATVIDALIALSNSPPTGPGDMEVWLGSCAFYIHQLRDLSLAIGAHSFMVQVLTKLPWTHDYLAAKAISDQIGKL